MALSLALAFTANAASGAEPYDINVVLPLTGAASFLGKGEQQAIMLLEKSLTNDKATIGDRPIRFVFHDDQSNPQTAVLLATQISRATPKPAVILGSTVVAMCNAMAPLMRSGPVMYCFSPGIYPAKDSFVFSSSVATRDLGSALLRYYRLKGWTKVALITSTDASGQDAARNFKELFAADENKGLQLVGETTFNPTELSVTAQIQRLKSSGAQALIAWSTGASIGTVFKAIADADWALPVGTTDGNMTYAQMNQYASFLPKELYIPASVWPVDEKVMFSGPIESAKKAYANAYAGTGSKPDAAGTFAWDPTLLVVAALRKLGPDATAEQVRTHIAGLKDFFGVNGIYDFQKDPQRGLDERNVVITRWNAEAAKWNIASEARGVPLKN